MKWIVSLLLISNLVCAQDLDQYRWKHRVVVVSADMYSQDKLEKQFLELIQNKKELIERKLVLYKCTGSSCMYYNFKDEPKSTVINEVPKGFVVRLYGLDGGQKLVSKKFIKAQDLFVLIDGMPMRKQEMKRKKKGND